MKVSSVLSYLLIFISGFGCISNNIFDKVCPFSEHSSQVFATEDGFFAFDVREYKNRQEGLIIRYFDKGGRQLCINEMNYPFSFYNFLVRSKDKDTLLLVSQNRTSGRENLVIEVTRDCQKKTEYNLTSENYETIADIKISDDNIYVCGWAESKNKDILSRTVKPQKDLIAVYDLSFINKKKFISGGDDAEYTFSVDVAPDKKAYFAGSIMKFGVDTNKGKVLKSIVMSINEVDLASDKFFTKSVEYPVSFGLMPFFIKEYNSNQLLVISAGKIEESDIFGVSIGEKDKLEFNTGIYQIQKMYLPFYPVLVRDDMLFLRLFNVRRGVMDRFYIVDLKRRDVIDVWIKGAKTLALMPDDEKIFVYYMISMKPCGESVYKAREYLIGDIVDGRVAKPDMSEGIFINKFGIKKDIKNFLDSY